MIFLFIILSTNLLYGDWGLGIDFEKKIIKYLEINIFISSATVTPE